MKLFFSQIYSRWVSCVYLSDAISLRIALILSCFRRNLHPAEVGFLSQLLSQTAMTSQKVQGLLLFTVTDCFRQFRSQWVKKINFHDRSFSTVRSRILHYYSPQTKKIRQEEECVNASSLRLFENQAATRYICLTYIVIVVVVG